MKETYPKGKGSEWRIKLSKALELEGDAGLNANHQTTRTAILASSWRTRTINSVEFHNVIEEQISRYERDIQACKKLLARTSPKTLAESEEQLAAIEQENAEIKAEIARIISERRVLESYTNFSAKEYAHNTLGATNAKVEGLYYKLNAVKKQLSSLNIRKTRGEKLLQLIKAQSELKRLEIDTMPSVGNANHQNEMKEAFSLIRLRYCMAISKSIANPIKSEPKNGFQKRDDKSYSIPKSRLAEVNAESKPNKEKRIDILFAEEMEKGPIKEFDIEPQSKIVKLRLCFGAKELFGAIFYFETQANKKKRVFGRKSKASVDICSHNNILSFSCLLPTNEHQQNNNIKGNYTIDVQTASVKSVIVHFSSKGIISFITFCYY